MLQAAVGGEALEPLQDGPAKGALRMIVQLLHAGEGGRVSPWVGREGSALRRRGDKSRAGEGQCEAELGPEPLLQMRSASDRRGSDEMLVLVGEGASLRRENGCEREEMGEGDLNPRVLECLAGADSLCWVANEQLLEEIQPGGAHAALESWRLEIELVHQNRLPHLSSSSH